MKAERKQQRRKVLLDLVRREAIANQGELQQRLAGRGFGVNQATLSRDLRELGIVKMPRPEGGSRYGLPVAETTGRTQLEATLQALVFSIRKSRNLLVFKTGPGQAPAPALALDNLHLPGIVGTVAGDDTFLAVLEEDADWDRIHRNMLKLVGLPG